MQDFCMRGEQRVIIRTVPCVYGMSGANVDGVVKFGNEV